MTKTKGMTTQTLAHARILLIVGGGVAAYKALDLIRRLRERGAIVRVAMTDAAKEFVTPLSLEALSGQPVRSDLFALTDESGMGHIEFSREADLVVVAPATANLLARMAQGLADDLATTTLLATDKRALVAPAMNLRMWLHPATQRNVATLRGDGVLFVGPDDGEMACGEYGPGRMAEPLAIVAAVERALATPTAIPLPPGVGSRASGALAGRRVVVTSGPTYEPIDPVRFLGNRSSGRQGHAIAGAAHAAGAEAILVSGPTALADPPGVTVVRVETAREMQAAVLAALPAEVFIAAAAVADWRSDEASGQKLKKRGGGAPILALTENPDILAEVARRRKGRPALVVGFAAETENLIDNARHKLARKGCDLIVANSVAAADGGFGGADNQVTIVAADSVEPWPRMSKAEVASALIALVARKLKEKR
jgi:phosphopantothenoylcysteine decarboxylase / phosphopantothenate---cysteine ligase